MSRPICVRLVGPDSALADALDRCHLRWDLLGVVVDDGEIRFSIRSDWDPGQIELPAEVRAEILPNVAEVTGLEGDAAIFVGDSVCVRPPWVRAPHGFAGVTLVVPRGGAFGSGEHGSTKAALLALDAAWPAIGESLLDVGTGSGILAAYAAARGVARIAACDVDEPSVRAARELVPTADVRLGGPDVFGDERFDTVVANLAGRELLAARSAVLAAWNGRGRLVLAGMRVAEEVEVSAAYGLATVARFEVDGFVACDHRA